MSATFTTQDLTRIEAASRALLAPLATATPSSWLLEAGGAIRDLLNGDAVAVMPPVRHDVAIVSHDAPSLGGAMLAASFESVAPDGMHFTDPVTEAWYHRTERTDTISWVGHANAIRPLGYRMEESILVSDVFQPYGIHNYGGFHVQTAAGDAAILVSGQRGNALRFGDRVDGVLRILAPAFRSGLDALARLGGFRHGLDAVPEPLVALDTDGRELYRNAALVRLLGADPEHVAVEAVLWRLAGEVRRLAFARRFEAPGPPGPMQRAASTARGRYTLSASLVPAGAFGPTETALISVAFTEAAAAAAARAAEAARAAFGLSAREAEVAALLAEGLANAAIADRLFVSPATVKRHVEAVLAKLGVANRTAVAARLLQPLAP